MKIFEKLLIEVTSKIFSEGNIRCMRAAIETRNVGKANYGKCVSPRNIVWGFSHTHTHTLSFCKNASICVFEPFFLGNSFLNIFFSSLSRRQPKPTNETEIGFMGKFLLLHFHWICHCLLCLPLSLSFYILRNSVLLFRINRS